MKDIIEYLSKKPKVFSIILGVVSLLFIGIVDYLTGYQLGLSIFYLVPISLVAWIAGGHYGILVSVFGAIVWFLADAMARFPEVPPLTVYWNAVVRFGYFFIISCILSRLKLSLDREVHLAKTDYLTGVANSRFFFELANMELNRMLRYKRTFAVAYIDIDNFKAVNDNLGHKIGDNLLSLVAQTIKNSIRKADIVARLGGDEFIILIPETNHEQSQVFINRVQKNLIDIIKKNDYNVTFSIGVVIYDTPPASVDEMISMADAQMYAAKRSSKNMIMYKIFGE